VRYLGYTVIRFTNREVFEQCEAVLQQIATECQRIIEKAMV
jgi:very-short-patch-repair endonuclease